MPKLFSDPEAIAEDIIRDVGTNLVIGLPLGLNTPDYLPEMHYQQVRDAWHGLRTPSGK